MVVILSTWTIIFSFLGLILQSQIRVCVSHKHNHCNTRLCKGTCGYKIVPTVPSVYVIAFFVTIAEFGKR